MLKEGKPPTLSPIRVLVKGKAELTWPAMIGVESCLFTKAILMFQNFVEGIADEPQKAAPLRSAPNIPHVT